MSSHLEDATLYSKVMPTKVSVDEILNQVVPLDKIDEILELVDLYKRRDSALYTQEYKNAISEFISQFDFANKNFKEFDPFLMQLIFIGSVLEDQSILFYKNLNRLTVHTINALFDCKDSTLKVDAAMYHMQMIAGEASIRIYNLEDDEFYLNKARQHFVMAASFVQEISAYKSFEAQTRISDVDILLFFAHNECSYVEQAIVDTHNAVEFGKSIEHRRLGHLLDRYSDLCDLLSDFRPEEREYWTEYSRELKEQAQQLLDE